MLLNDPKLHLSWENENKFLRLFDLTNREEYYGNILDQDCANKYLGPVLNWFVERGCRVEFTYSEKYLIKMTYVKTFSIKTDNVISGLILLGLAHDFQEIKGILRNAQVLRNRKTSDH